MPPPPTDRAWADTVAGLVAASEELSRALETLPEERLDEMVGQHRDASLGTSVTHYVTLHGLAQHDAYHTGQISLLKKALGAGGAASGSAP